MSANGPARSQSEVAVRLARHGDYSAVMRISAGLYYSTDYVPAKFHSLTDDPDHTVFVAEVGDQVVGMAASKYTEDGRVFIGKAARVAPDWRGQGISTELCVQGAAWIRQHRPTVKYVRGVTLSVSPMTKQFQTRKRHIFSSATGAAPVSGGDRTLLSWLNWSRPAYRTSCLYRTQTTTSVRPYRNGFPPGLVVATTVNPSYWLTGTRTIYAQLT
ncbi:PREDICTED: probable N-acetyltransferase 16 [Branchiostoma belcheri]|uniref:Probable N-acetyltransferase 16 n=1 Tax=Branchiostoma belcheri TaxID=7741 RepID=A0A6P4Y203_BRABE|nr:PREDICTED: probable N-acetyltransferase 16 [Branchiostoma belcheri]